MKATAVLPVKRFDAAKQRLAAGIEDERRRALVAAMVADVLEAIAEARTIERTIVVTSEPEARRRWPRRPAPSVIPDSSESGHVDAALAGIARAQAEGATCVVLLPGDCPLLDPRELDRLLTGVPESYVGIVPDRHGAGTNALVAQPAGRDRPRLRRGQPRAPRRRRPRRRRRLQRRGAALARARPRHPGRRRRPDLRLERGPGRGRRTAKVLGI